MGLLWCDGFDHYGTDENNMLDGVYASVEDSGASAAHSNQLSTTFVATGTHSYYIGNQNGLTNEYSLRKVLPASLSKFGVCMRVYFPTLPTQNGVSTILEALSSTITTSQLSACVTTSGAIAFYRGNSYFNANTTADGTIVATTDPIITAGAWHHIEIQMNINDTTGWVRVAVNGVHRYQATGLDTRFNSATIESLAHHISRASFADVDDVAFYLDDLIYYNFVGDSAVDTDFCPAVDGNGVATNYIGELQCIYLPPNGDTAEADWTKSTGTDGFALIDETTPNDADYISSATAGDLSEFDLTDLPPEITYIRGVQLLGRLSKSDSGTAMTKFGMNSDGTTDDEAERAITVEPTYWWDFMNVDPDSGSRWTRTSLNAAKIRLTRSA